MSFLLIISYVTFYHTHPFLTNNRLLYKQSYRTQYDVSFCRSCKITENYMDIDVLISYNSL